MNAATEPQRLAQRGLLRSTLAGRYLTLLCRHFRHKVAVTLEGSTGIVAFPRGDCVLKAEDDTLIASLAAADQESLAKLRYILDAHIVRFAYRDKASFAWEPRRLEE